MSLMKINNEKLMDLDDIVIFIRDTFFSVYVIRFSYYTWY